MHELWVGSSITDKIIFFFFVLQALRYVHYLYWQFSGSTMQEESMTKIIRAFDLFEWGAFVLIRFVPLGKMGRFAWGGFIVFTLFVLILQFVLAEWGMVERLKTGAWITYYVFLFLIDVMGINVIGIFVDKYGASIAGIDAVLKNSWAGKVLASIIVFIVKVLIKSKIDHKKK